MFGENEYFLTMDCQMYDNKQDEWAKAWGSDEFMKRTEGGVTYAARSVNRKNRNHVSVVLNLMIEKL